MVVPESTMSTLPESVLEPDKQRPIPWVRLVVGLAVLGLASTRRCYLTPSDNKTPVPGPLPRRSRRWASTCSPGSTARSPSATARSSASARSPPASSSIDHGWAFEPTIPVAALLAAVVGVLIGFPALRVRGLYLALITLGLAVLFPPVVASKYVDGLGGVALLQPAARIEFNSLIDSLDERPVAVLRVPRSSS